MATITCAISGIRFHTDYLSDIVIPQTEGYFHPVFALSNKQLHQLYSKHTAGKLTNTDSYLTFLALLHSSDSIIWRHPATLDPSNKSTQILIANNISQLVAIIAKTACIVHPSFKQPKYVVDHNNCQLGQVSSWIKAWQANIDSFNSYSSTIRTIGKLNQVEEYLSKLILSGEDPQYFSHTIAEWADLAADFPPAKREEYKRVIRSCFNTAKMFNTPLALIKEIKDYCECNIEAGSIHFHTLSKVLKAGIAAHVDYLGGNSMARGYELLPDLADSDTLANMLANEKAISDIISKAPDKPPVESDYPDKLAYIRAKLAYRVKTNNTPDNKDITNL